ncbi:hypothetical protein F4806DRAFT_19321 [Annulohypoxylon nitens]|nr:hypothetical protein F4806DRAFT_19321 [Annulohypoxylon nitens]
MHASCSGLVLVPLGGPGDWQLTNPRNYAYMHPQCNNVIFTLDASRLGEAIGRYTVCGRFQLCSIVVSDPYTARIPDTSQMFLLVCQIHVGLPSMFVCNRCSQHGALFRTPTYLTSCRNIWKTHGRPRSFCERTPSNEQAENSALLWIGDGKPLL